MRVTKQITVSASPDVLDAIQAVEQKMIEAVGEIPFSRSRLICYLAKIGAQEWLSRPTSDMANSPQTISPSERGLTV